MRWIRRFERFRKASSLDQKEDEAQVNTLIYSMGDEADDILRSFNLSEADSKKYTKVREKFDAHFVKRRNVIFERAKFNQRKQEDGESVDAFITALYSLSEHCNYGELHDEMIRDRIVVGIRDATLAEKLQLDAELTLDRAVTRVRQAEAVKQQQPVIRGGENKEVLVGKIHRPKPQASTPVKTARRPKPKTEESDKCTHCGRAPKHDRRSCPAREVECRKCGKTGHFQAVCWSRKGKLRQITASNPEPEEEQFLGAVGENS